MDVPQTEAEIPADFNETAYLAAYPKIADNIRAGFVKSALDHYTRKGIAENRLEQPRYRKALAEQQLLSRLSAPPSTADASHEARGWLPSGLDTLLVTPEGTCLVIGWVDDRGLSLHAISLALPDGRSFRTEAIARCRRADAEAAIGCPPGYLLGFYALLDLGQAGPPAPGSTVLIHCGGDPVSHPARPHLMEAATLRDSAFEYLAAAGYFGAHAVETFLQMDRGMGAALLRLNQSLSARIAAHAYVERHGDHARRFRGSIVVCLYGKPEYLFLQAAAFSAAPGASDYEYVYVSNSPELTETLQREARIAARLYNLCFTLIFLPGNAGFGAANNVAASLSASGRVLICNPDVFPRDNLWARRHSDIVDGLPAEQTQFWGAPLFYDDGSLMHGGMFIACDPGLSVRADGIVRQDLLRVEHYGKGAPPDTKLYRTSRRVPAVTGAFISVERAWFEKIGGFSEEYVFGQKTWHKGGQVWMHDLPLWHLEGKGSTRKPAHDGGSMLNRWHFTRTWLAAVQDGWGGPDPARMAP